MTNGEAIDLLDNLVGMVSDNHDADYDEAIRMAIEALRSQPIHCKDCVHMQYDEIFNVMYCDGKQISPMHYCGYAERRADDE